MEIKKPVINNNLMIALFMGAVIDGEYPKHVLLDMGKKRTQNKRYWSSSELKYHYNWEWIMSVITKCEELGGVFIIHKRHCVMNDNIFTDPVDADKLLNVYYAVSVFIHTHNAVLKEKQKTYD